MGGSLQDRRMGYAIAIVATLAVGILRFGLNELLGETAPFLPFIVPLLLASYFGGWRAGGVALVLSSFLGVFLFTEPRFSLRIEQPGEAAGLVIFFVYGVAVIWLCELLHALHSRLARERSDAEESLQKINTELSQKVSELNTLVEMLPVGVWIGDRECQQIKGNRAAYEAFGLPPGINASLSVPPHDALKGVKSPVPRGAASVHPRASPTHLPHHRAAVASRGRSASARSSSNRRRRLGRAWFRARAASSRSSAPAGGIRRRAAQAASRRVTSA